MYLIGTMNVFKNYFLFLLFWITYIFNLIFWSRLFLGVLHIEIQASTEEEVFKFMEWYREVVVLRSTTPLNMYVFVQ